MKKFMISISPILALWAVLMIIVPKFGLFDVHVLKYIMQFVLAACGVIFVLSALYIMGRILFFILSNIKGQQFLNREALTTEVASIRPAQIIAIRSWLFAALFLGVGFLATYIGKVFSNVP